MGQRVRASVEFNGDVSEGVVLLEPDSLVFRGGFKLSIPLKQVKTVAARRGQLKVTFPEGTAVFDIGELAEKWASKIRHPKSLMDKLGVKAESRVVVLGLRDRGFISQLKERTPDVSERRRRNADLIFLRAESVADLEKLSPLQEWIKRDGAIWVIAPKGKQHIKEADVLEAGKRAGLVDIKVVSFSETHTAHKLVIPVARR